MGLEIQTGKVPGNVVRTTPAERPAFIGLLIIGLLLVILLFFGLVMHAFYLDAIADPKHVDENGRHDRPGANNAATHDPAIPNLTFSIFGFKDVTFFNNEQTIISFWIACMFFALTDMIFLYQRYFKDHVTINKKRFRKWEDEGVQLHD